MPYNPIAFFVLFLSLFSLSPNPAKMTAVTATAIAAKTQTNAEAAYALLKAGAVDVPSEDAFLNAAEGFFSLKSKGQLSKDILTIADFSQSSNTKRLWVIDMANYKILYNTLVAHGRNTGNEFATSFSNVASSYKSSLGLYTTGAVYTGKHGMSLKLNGLEKGVNDNALARAVVMHGADYVSESFIKANSRLGRSLGCPAIPNDMVKPIINAIKGKSCLYIYHPCHCKKNKTAVT